MRRGKRWAFTALFVLVGAALIVPAVVLAGPGSSVTVRYGNPNAGTSFEPAEHDASFHAYDKINPRTVTISAGGSVSFAMLGFPHQVAVYNPGIGPEDIAVPAFPPEDNIFIGDSTGRKFLGTPPFGPGAPPPGTQPTESVTFTTPGKYLMICNITPHFAFAKMYGWIDVK